MRWTETADSLHCEVRTPDFVTAYDLVGALVPVAEGLGHHPDLALGWGYLRITLTTHDAGGLTHKDRELAEAIDRVLEGRGFPA